MQSEVSASELLKMVNKALAAYEQGGISSIGRRTRVLAMHKYVTALRKQSPQKKITLSLEDFLVLTELPE